jgi:prepilin-type N-terminal cleavage/methylation domain-containing protein
MSERTDISCSGGFSLIELLFALGVLGMCLAVGGLALDNRLSTQEARGAAQSWQAAAAWAQVGVLWQGGSTRFAYDFGSLSLVHDYGLCGGGLEQSAPGVSLTTNVARWSDDEGATVAFAGNLASPNGGGSLYFHAQGNAYRVVVRPESGITVRSLVETGP